MLVDLVSILGAMRADHGVPAFSVFGFEDCRAVITAAEKIGAPVILSAGPDFRRAMPLSLIAATFRTLGEAAQVPVCAHLDHGYDADEVLRAVDLGFTSVMFDGSQSPLAQNIAQTRRITDYAHAASISVEGEIGSVPYVEGRPHIKSELTHRDDAARFAQESGVDAVAVSVGNVHRLTTQSVTIDFDRVAEIAAVVPVPLVIHGTSGIRTEDRLRLIQSGVAKFNIGTVLRQSFGRGVRSALAARPNVFDRLEIMDRAMSEMTLEAMLQYQSLGWPIGVEVAKSP